VTLEQGKELANKLGVSFFEASAKADSSVKEAFSEIIDAVRKAKAKIVADIAMQNSDDLKLNPNRTTNRTHRPGESSDIKVKKPPAKSSSNSCSCCVS
jgi:GTPase SAR1 family protein